MSLTNARLGRWTRGAVCCMSITVLAWIGAGIVLRVVAPEDTGPAAFVGGDTGHQRWGFGRDTVSSRVSFPVFGAGARSRNVESRAVVRNEGYSLRGTYESGNGRGFAVLESGGVATVYSERDHLPGGETIAEIGPNRVIVIGDRGSSLVAFESLELPRFASGGEPVAAADAGAEAELERRPPLSHGTLIQQALSTDALSSVGFSRVRARDGQVGLRVKWLRKSDLTDALGLHRGDIVKAVNGLPVDDPKTMRALFEALPASGEIVIDLERRSSPYRLVIPLSHG